MSIVTRPNSSPKKKKKIRGCKTCLAQSSHSVERKNNMVSFHPCANGCCVVDRTPFNVQHLSSVSFVPGSKFFCLLLLFFFLLFKNRIWTAGTRRAREPIMKMTVSTSWKVPSCLMATCRSSWRRRHLCPSSSMLITSARVPRGSYSFRYTGPDLSAPSSCSRPTLKSNSSEVAGPNSLPSAWRSALTSCPYRPFWRPSSPTCKLLSLRTKSRRSESNWYLSYCCCYSATERINDRASIVCLGDGARFAAAGLRQHHVQTSSRRAWICLLESHRPL